MENETEFIVGQKVKCVKNDPMDDMYDVHDDLRWHIGDEFIVDSIDVFPYGTFLNDGKGHNLNVKRAVVVQTNIKDYLTLFFNNIDEYLDVSIGFIEDEKFKVIFEEKNKFKLGKTKEEYNEKEVELFYKFLKIKNLI